MLCKDLHNKGKIEPYFLNYQYQTLNAKKKIENITTGNTIKHILASDMQEFVVDVSSYEEQKHIASLLNGMDKTITLHQQKLDQIKEYKKGMLQKMFPKKGEVVPEVRFPGFEGDWEERKFRDVSDKLCVGFVGTCEKFYTDESKGIPLYRTGNIKDGVLVEYDMKYVKMVWTCG